MFCKFVFFDLKNGLLKEWKKFLFSLCTFITFFLFHFMRFYAENMRLKKAGESEITFTFSDFILSVLGGMKTFSYQDGTAFIFPALWTFFFLLLMFFILRYPTQNLDGIGKTMLVLSQNRRTWWFSKCIWCCCYVLVYFALFYVSAFLTGLCLGGKLTLQPSDYAPAILDAGMYIKNPPWDITSGLILINLMTCGIALLQMFFTLCFRPIFAYVLTCILLISSAYFSSPFFVGNYAMLFRVNIIVKDGFPLAWGFLAAAITILFSIAAGYFRMEHMDILTKE